MSERQSNGQFAKGWKGGPGRPKKKREERYYEITMSACTFADWRKIVKKAVEQSKRGDAVARKWLSEYIVGTPEQTLNLMGDSLLDVNIHYVEHSEIS